MAKKEFMYKGKSVEELKNMTPKEFAEIAPARIRRTIRRGLRKSNEVFLAKFRKKKTKELKTHCRGMVILPEMIGRTIKIYTGKDFKAIEIMPEMVGHFFGEYALTRNKVAHSSPGIGATKSSAHTSVK